MAAPDPGGEIRMTDTAHPAASPFLMPSDTACPPALLSLATGAPARPVALFDATGTTVLTNGA